MRRRRGGGLRDLLQEMQQVALAEGEHEKDAGLLLDNCRKWKSGAYSGGGGGWYLRADGPLWLTWAAQAAEKLQAVASPAAGVESSSPHDVGSKSGAHINRKQHLLPVAALHAHLLDGH